MTDNVSVQTRSRIMSRIRSGHTAPELAVRRYLHAAGLRYRLHAKGLPGRPDLVLGRFRVAIFVHGCFWHRHPECRFCTNPSTNVGFWRRKFEGNMQRDRATTEALSRLGWKVIIIWECETRSEQALDNLFWRIVESA